MKNLPVTFALLLALATGCQSSDRQQTAASDASAYTPTAAPVAASTPVAGSSTPNVPSLLPTTAIDVRPAVEQLLPEQGYLQTVSAKTLKVEPMTVALPPLWGSLQPGAARAMPGCRISYEAVLQWVPAGYGASEKVPATMALYAPNGRDSLARYRLGGVNANVPGQEKYTELQVAPNKPVTVRGVVYAFTGKDNQQKPALVVYPYRHKGEERNPSNMTFLPLSQ